VLVELLGGFVMVAQHGGFLERAVHAFDLAIGPRMGRLGQAVFHAVRAANAVKAVPAGKPLVRLQGELYPVVRQYGVGFVRQGLQHAAQELGRQQACGARVQLGKGHFAGAVHGHEQVHLALLGAHLRKVHVQVSDGVLLDLLFGGTFSVLGQGQAADAVALREAVQGRTGQPRNAGLQRVKTIVQRQLRVLAKRHGGRFFR
jgi:hypothetical protein